MFVIPSVSRANDQVSIGIAVVKRNISCGVSDTECPINVDL